MISADSHLDRVLGLFLSLDVGEVEIVVGVVTVEVIEIHVGLTERARIHECLRATGERNGRCQRYPRPFPVSFLLALGMPRRILSKLRVGVQFAAKSNARGGPQ